MFYTYTLFSDNLGVYHIGFSQNLERRLLEHNRGKTTFAAKGMPWRIVYKQECYESPESIDLLLAH
ncbi:MAG: GIY-YIG nuclease family protein [Bacteroidia bacterium]|nr:GIY-YIG nuclease family protein [Bacteroidia bacterium]